MPLERSIPNHQQLLTIGHDMKARLDDEAERLGVRGVNDIIRLALSDYFSKIDSSPYGKSDWDLIHRTFIEFGKHVEYRHQFTTISTKATRDGEQKEEM